MISSTSSTVRRFASLTAIAALSLSAFGCGGGGAADPSGANHPLVGKAAPDFSAEFVTGDGPKSVKEGQGKVLILDFWGTFCEPCKKSFPKYQELVDQFGGDAVVLAVSVDDPADKKKEQVEGFAKENHAKFSIVWDKEHKAAKLYGMDDLTMPVSFIIDKSGVVRHVHVGYHDGEDSKIAEEVKALTGK